MTEPIRWCDTHKMRASYDTHNDKWECRESDTLGGCAEVVLLVESRDGDGRLLGLLAADQCANHFACDVCGLGRGVGTIGFDWCDDCVANRRDHLGVGCRNCGGSGHTLRAERIPHVQSDRKGGIEFAGGNLMVVLPVEQP